MFSKIKETDPLIYGSLIFRRRPLIPGNVNKFQYLSALRKIFCSFFLFHGKHLQGNNLAYRIKQLFLHARSKSNTCHAELVTKDFGNRNHIQISWNTCLQPRILHFGPAWTVSNFFKINVNVSTTGFWEILSSWDIFT